MSRPIGSSKGKGDGDRGADVDKLKARVVMLQTRVASLEEKNNTLKLRIGTLENECERAKQETRFWAEQATALRSFKGEYARRSAELRRPQAER